MTFTPWVILIASLKVVEFTQPTFWGIPWWVPVGFGVGLSGSFFLFAVADHLLKIQVNYNPAHLGLEYLLISGIYISVFFFRQYPYLLLLGLLFVILVRLILFHETFDWVFFIFGACVGPTMELILSNIGLYHFIEPDFLGMPFWLPVFWGNVALAIRRVGWILAPTQVPDPSVMGMEFGPR